MEFDKSNVYTALNADEIKAGDKVIVADTVEELMQCVSLDYNNTILKCVRNRNSTHRFISSSDNSYLLAYLVERAAKKKWRAYKDCDEMIADFKRRLIESEPNGTAVLPDSLMWHPMIWVRRKDTDRKQLCTSFGGTVIGIDDETVNFDTEEVFNDYTYLDGSPCGVEE